MNVLIFIARRLAYAVGLLLAVLLLNFALLHAAPGDIVQTIAGEMGGASPEIIAQLNRSWGLDRPFHEQLAHYLWRAAHGDLGNSAYFNMPVSGLVVDRIPAPIVAKPPALQRPPRSALRKDGSADVKIDVVIDTLGRADMRTFKVVSASNAWLATNVKSVIGKWTFAPAELAGCKVPRTYHFMAAAPARQKSAG